MTSLAALQRTLSAGGFDAFFVPSTDEFLSEYVSPASERLKWATGFSGTTGVAVITPTSAALFVDGRYTEQAQRECKDLPIEVLSSVAVEPMAWLTIRIRPGGVIAIDPRLHPAPFVNDLKDKARKAGFILTTDAGNFVDLLWREGRPPAPLTPVEAYPLEYSGQSSDERIEKQADELRLRGLDGYLLTDPEDIAWLLNIRARDLSVVPVCFSYAWLDASGSVTWFVDSSRLPNDLPIAACTSTAAPESMAAWLRDRVAGKAVGLNLPRTNFAVAQMLSTATMRDDNFIERRRWLRNPVEVEQARLVQRENARATIEFLAWLQAEVGVRRITEIEAAEKLAEIRGQSPRFRGLATKTTSASGPSAALPHYKPTPQNNRTLNDHPIYLLDSGGQYLGHTTDNTVTIALSTPTPFHRKVHTLVLKGLIALSAARFPEGTLASQLDTLARLSLWEHGLDYAHATGHGVGNFLNIHAGPVVGKFHITSSRNTPMDVGTIITNEPACYFPGDFGVRLETHILVTPSEMPGFLEFDTISRLPIDPELVDPSLLTPSETGWLRRYHQCVWDDCKDQLTPAATAWLRQKVEPFLGAAISVPR